MPVGESNMHAVKAQSAMEYLMTYGWAILIIAVVLAALYAAGVFNPNTFAPRAQPGSCSVYRPYGPGSTQFISTEGPCNSEEPKFVAQFSGSGYTKQNIQLNQLPDYTIIAWINPSQNSFGTIYAEGESYCSVFSFVGNPLSINVWNVHLTNNWLSTSSDFSAPVGIWSMVAVTLSNGGSGTGTAKFYLNGETPYSAGSQEENYPGGGLSSLIGGGYTCSAFVGSYLGELANVQIYNTTLSASEIQALYQEGIGGPPIKLQNLVSWWPLNGNPTDYSGDNHNGIATNVIYTSSWDSGYTAP